MGFSRAASRGFKSCSSRLLICVKVLEDGELGSQANELASSVAFWRSKSGSCAAWSGSGRRSISAVMAAKCVFCGICLVSHFERIVFLPIARGLHFKHSGIASPEIEERLVVAIFHDVSVFENHDPIRHAHSGKAMRDEQGGLSRGEFGKALKDFKLAAGVERGGRLVQNEDLRI